MNMEAIDRAFECQAGLDWLELEGLVMRDATLEDVEHYFIYHADEHASMYLGGPSGDDGLRRAA